jgi:hypothetical protein
VGQGGSKEYIHFRHKLSRGKPLRRPRHMLEDNISLKFISDK